MTTPIDPTKGDRIEALDFTKGLLVVFMVAYHSLNYSATPGMGFRCFPFLPPSFVLITGFLLSNVYLKKYGVASQTRNKRLLARGLKLLLLFTALNVIMNLALHGNHKGHLLGIRTFCTEWYPIYIIGGQRWASFEVLLPISYILLLSPLFFKIDTMGRHALAAVLVALVLLSLCLESGTNAPINLMLFTAGLLGMVLGKLSRSSLEPLALWWPYLMAVDVLCVYFGFNPMAQQLFIMQYICSCISLAVIFGLGIRCGSRGRFQRVTILLGKYSLLSYIAQIAVLQIVARAEPRLRDGTKGLGVLFVTTLIITFCTVWIVRYARVKSFVADRIYKIIFA